MESSPTAARVPRGILRSRIVPFFRARPIVVLLLFSPGLVEYVTGSSALSAVVFNPPFFLFQLLLNVGVYGPGVLLVREAQLRWRTGWAGVLVMGIAFGIVEEGLAAGTLFNPRALPVLTAGLATYGRFLGVNWVWAVMILLFHALFSITLPIVLLGLALPESRGRALLGPRGISAAFLVGALDIGVSEFLVWKLDGFVAGP